jgi:hypothetical protein
VQFLTDFKEYLGDRPETAIAALALLAVWYLFRKYDKAQLAHMATLSKVAPLAEKLCAVIDKLKKNACKEKP